ADLDRVAEAPDDVQRALVDEPRVAREQGPVADRAGAAGLAALVPVGHGLAADDDLAEVPVGELLPVRAGDRDRDSLDRLPAARQPAGRAVERVGPVERRGGERLDALAQPQGAPVRQDRLRYRLARHAGN